MRPARPIADRTTLTVWAILMISTVASWAIGTNHGHGDTWRQAGTVGVIAIAFAKVQLVGEYFMGLSRAPIALRGAFSVWVIGVCTTVVSIYRVRG